METNRSQVKIYSSSEVVVFRKTKEEFGGLSNMASGFPIIVNNVHFLTSEALYQACRFPHLPDVQEKIIREKSPMSAKMVSKPFRPQSRPDWDNVRVSIMRWCLQVKLAQNFIEFGKLLESTFDKPIVEDSSKDDYWGAIRSKKEPNILVGTNALGRLLMELRQNYNLYRYTPKIFYIEPLNIPDFRIFEKEIEVIDERERFINLISAKLNVTQKLTKASTYFSNIEIEAGGVEKINPSQKPDTSKTKGKSENKKSKSKAATKKLNTSKNDPTLFDTNPDKL